VISERRDRDLQDCTTLLTQVHINQRYPIHWPDDPIAWLTPRDMVAAWLAARDGEVLGHVCLASKGLVTPDLTLDRLFVSPAVGGRGVGRALVTHASEWAAARGRRLSLDVVENCTNAVTLYRRLGWRQSGRTRIDWGDDVAQYLLHFDAPSR
jgi:[ribosomal protein S18]-alanine N-acetyltransferase